MAESTKTGPSAPEKNPGSTGNTGDFMASTAASDTTASQNAANQGAVTPTEHMRQMDQQDKGGS